MDAAEVRGGLFLNEGFHAASEVRLPGSLLGLQVNCSGAKLEGSPNSLIMDGAEVRGSVFLTGGFTAKGTVRLPQVSISLQLNCKSAEMHGEPWSLILDGAEVRGAVFLTDGFTAAGSVRAPEARVGVQLNCKGATLGGGKRALILDGADVTGSLVLGVTWAQPPSPAPEEPAATPSSPQPQVSLRAARVGRLRLESSGDPRLHKSRLTSTLLLEGATYRGLAGPEPSEGVRPRWPRRVAASVRGTSELERLPGMLYRASLVGQQDAPGGQVYPGTFDAAARVLRDAGSERLARQLLIERHRQLTRQRPQLARPIGWLLDITVGYGFRPRLALLWALLVYLGAVLVFWLAVHHGGLVATPLAGTRGSPSPLRSTAAYPVFSAWNYAFGALLLPFVHLPGIDAWRANATNGWGIAVRVVRWFEPVVLWSLLIILGATFTTLVTRDQR